MKAVYAGSFDSKSDVEKEFGASLDGCNVLFAAYDTPSYEGYAWVLFRKDRKLYEVNGSHCSCYGLEGQWDPEEVSKEALKHRIKEGHLGYAFGMVSEEVKKWLKV